MSAGGTGLLQACFHGLQELAPGCHEFLHALIFQHLEDIAEINTELTQAGENLLSLLGGIGEGVAVADIKLFIIDVV